jgi:hypothetical protein
MAKNTKPRIAALNSITCCRRDLGRLYRSWRHGDLDDSALRAGCYALHELRECLIHGELEDRLAALENEGPSYER